jgi:hypothetical protein
MSSLRSAAALLDILRKNLILHFGINGLESFGQFVCIHFPQDSLDRTVVEHDDVLEDEHTFLDLLGKFRIFFFKRFNNGFLCGSIDKVENVDNALHSAGCCIVLVRQGG